MRKAPAQEWAEVLLSKENQRMMGVGRHLWRSLSPTLLPKQDHLGQAKQDQGHTKLPDAMTTSNHLSLSWLTLPPHMPLCLPSNLCPALVPSPIPPRPLRDAVGSGGSCQDANPRQRVSSRQTMQLYSQRADAPGRRRHPFSGHSLGRQLLTALCSPRAHAGGPASLETQQSLPRTRDRMENRKKGGEQKQSWSQVGVCPFSQAWDDRK